MLLDWSSTECRFPSPQTKGLRVGDVAAPRRNRRAEPSERMTMSKPPGGDRKARVPFEDSHYIVTPVSPSREGPGFRALNSQGLRVWCMKPKPPMPTSKPPPSPPPPPQQPPSPSLSPVHQSPPLSPAPALWPWPIAVCVLLRAILGEVGGANRLKLLLQP